MIVLETKRLTLRRYTPGDLGELLEMLSDPEVMRFYPAVLDERGAQEWLEKIFAKYEKTERRFSPRSKRGAGSSSDK